tara:strand:+ start:516 stop:1289 length:774 start_codon:yes stop_codon:yes gene_type:complete
MKKESVLLGLFIIAISGIFFNLDLITAQGYPLIETIILDVGEGFESIFRPIIGGETGDDFLMVKIMFFLVTFIVVYLALQNTDLIGSNRGALFIISISGAIISARYIPDVGIIKSMILPWLALITSINSLIIPLSLVFILHTTTNSPLFRRAIFTGAAILYGLYWSGGYWSQTWEVVQGTNFYISLLPLLIFVVAAIWDETIQKSFLSEKYTKAAQELRERQVQGWLEQLRIAEENGDQTRVKRVKRVLKKRYGVKT